MGRGGTTRLRRSRASARRRAARTTCTRTSCGARPGPRSSRGKVVSSRRETLRGKQSRTAPRATSSRRAQMRPWISRRSSNSTATLRERQRRSRTQSGCTSSRGTCSPRVRHARGSQRRSSNYAPIVPWDELSDEQREIRDLVRALARERIAPRAAEIDASHEFPWDVVELYRGNDLFGLFFEERHGGLGTGTLLALIAIEEVSKVCATSALILAVQELGSLGIKLAGSDGQKERWLPPLASGEWLCAYALTEAGSGSDSAAMRTSARREGDGYLLNGSKRFITNAGVAQLYTVFAKTDPDAGHAGISAFVVEAETPGFEVARVEPKMGIRGSTTGELTFDDARVPADNLLGEEGDGFKLAMRILDRSRPGVAAQGLGIAQGAPDYARCEAKSRETRGEPPG